MTAAQKDTPVTIIVFGATGDLAKRKLYPAIRHLLANGQIDAGTHIVGVARSKMSDGDYRTLIRGDEGPLPGVTRATYVSGNFTEPSLYRDLLSVLAKAPKDRLYYLATPPQAIPDIVGGLVQRRIPNPRSRVVVEKPFGWDEASARDLSRTIERAFPEKNVFRIDHYLGKETVQNILVLRFSNGIMEPLWNRSLVDHVQITVAETVGVESRGGYYDRAGALRDMVQNHLLQLLALVAMEPPSHFSADAVRDEKVKLFHALRIGGQDDAVRGYYTAGAVLGAPVVGYRDEPSVPEGSRRETFAALRAYIDNWRWAGVPFYLRTGKRLPNRSTRVSIVFKKPPLRLFEGAQQENILSLHIQPDEGVGLAMGAKRPGLGTLADPVAMTFFYDSAFPSASREAYERLLLDALTGEATLFTREDEVEAAWHALDALEAAWESGGEPLPYVAGTWGPMEAAELISRDGRAWIDP